MEAQQEVVQEQQINQTVDPFSQNAWKETVVEPIKAEEPVEVKSEPVHPQPTSIENVEEIIDPKEWLKREFSVDDTEVLKQQLKDYEELKKKSSEPQEEKFENEHTRVIYDALRNGETDKVLDFLSTQSKLNKLLSVEITDDNAPDIIKAYLKITNSDLNDSEIDHKYKKMYQLPKEPELDVDDPDSVAAHKEWQEQVEDIKISRRIDAKSYRPELAKSKAELKFPEIIKEQKAEANQPDPETIKKLTENFINTLERDYSKVEGFTTQVKDESVEIPVAFKIPDEEKSEIKQILGGGFDIDSFITERWFNEKGEPNVERMITDFYLLNNTDKVLSGIANNAANLRLVQSRKQAVNSTIGADQQNTFQPNAGGKTNVSPFSDKAWSDKPTVFTN